MPRLPHVLSQISVINATLLSRNSPDQINRKKDCSYTDDDCNTLMPSGTNPSNPLSTKVKSKSSCSERFPVQEQGCPAAVLFLSVSVRVGFVPVPGALDD
jgi:hypothetical protein